MKKRGKILAVLSPIIVLVAMFVALEILVATTKMPYYVMARPSESFVYLYENFDSVMTNCVISLKNYFIGYPIGAFLGIVLAFVFSTRVRIQKAFSPYLTVISCVPMIVMVPLFKIWFGLGNIVNILVCILSCFSIVCSNAMLGIGAVPEERLELVETCKGTKLQAFIYVVIPSALPHISTGLKLGSIFALSGIIGSEMIGSMEGIGYQIVWSNTYFNIAALFAYVYVLMLFGYIIFSLLSVLESRITKAG